MKTAHQFCFSLRQVKRYPVRFGDGSREIDQETHRLHKQIPVRKERIESAHVPGPLLVLDDLAQAQRSRQHQHTHHRQAQGEFVADHLRRRAQPAKKRVLAVRGPPGQRNTVYAERGHGKYK